MAIRFVDQGALRGQLSTTLDSAAAAMSGSNIAPPSRAGVLGASLLGSTILLSGLFASAPNRTAVIGTILDGLTSSISGASTSTVAGAPKILKIDTPHGCPFGGAGTTGDENGKGGYVSIYGFNLYSGNPAGQLGNIVRVFFGSQEAGDYRFLGPCKVTAAGMPISPPLQHIIVQAGALGSLVNGTNYPVTVVSGGVTSNADVMIMPNPGKINWVDAVNGNDSGSHTGISNPWRTPQIYTASTDTISGMISVANQPPGCQNIFRAGTYSTTGKDGMLFRFHLMGGLTPTGTAGTGGIHNTPYPGPPGGAANAYENAVLFRPSGQQSCIGGNDSARGLLVTQPNGQHYAWGITISNFVMNEDPAAIDGPVNVGCNSDAWFVGNCELGPWVASGNSKAAGVAGDGVGDVVFANYIHNLNSNTGETHGVYMDGSNTGAGGSIGTAAHNWEICYNYIKNITGGSGIQGYGAASNGNDVITGANVHHNVIDTVSKYGLNAADVMRSGIFWDNLIMNTGAQGIRTNPVGITGTKVNGGPAALSFVNNTVYNPMTASSGGTNSCFGNEGNVSAGYLELTGNLFILGANRSNSSLAWIGNSASLGAGVLQANGNGYFDPQGHNTSKDSSDAAGVYGDPLVRTQWTDFRIQHGSPMANKAPASQNGVTVPNDLDGRTRPLSGNTLATIGCYEILS